MSRFGRKWKIDPRSKKLHPVIEPDACMGRSPDYDRWEQRRRLIKDRRNWHLSINDHQPSPEDKEIEEALAEHNEVIPHAPLTYEEKWEDMHGRPYPHDYMDEEPYDDYDELWDDYNVA